MTSIPSRSRKRLLRLGVAAVTSLALLGGAGAAADAGPARLLAAARTPAVSGGSSGDAPTSTTRRVNFRLLSINDFHGQLEPSTSSSSGTIEGTPAGGAAYLATHLRHMRSSARAEGRKPITVAAGDLIGATPLISAAFHDEPTIEAMNRMRLKVASVGNHEFDEGWRELRRMQNGGCIKDGAGADNQNSCPNGRFEGADFQYLSANVIRNKTGRTVLPAVKVIRSHKVPVAFIGMTLQDTPNIVTASGVRGLRFTDEVRTANRIAKKLYRSGIKSIVVLLHEGGFPTGGYDECEGMSGPILDINAGLSSRIDMVLTGHTHQAYNCTLSDPRGNPRLVTSAASLGRLVTKIDFTVDRRTGDIDRDYAEATNVIVTRTVEANAGMAKLIDTYLQLVAPIANEVIGTLTGTSVVSRTADSDGESPLGNLIADAQRADSSLLAGGAAPEIAIMNPGGIRSDLVANPDGTVTYGAAFTTQPFNNYDVAMDLTGAQILELLEEQWSGANAGSPRVLQVSGLTYSYSLSAPAGAKVDASTVQVNGAPLNAASTYRVVANSFLAGGGDGFATFLDATNKYVGGLDIDALADYLGANDPYTPVATDRITATP